MNEVTEKVLVLVRATPEESRKHDHLVCVAGINENDQWRRLYPFMFSYGEGLINFRKKDTIEVTLANPDNDKRRESRKVAHHQNLNLPLSDDGVRERILPLVSSIEKLSEENASLGVIKPELQRIDVTVNSTDIYDEQTYFSIAGDYLERRERVKMPVELRYRFRCSDEPGCKGHNLDRLGTERTGKKRYAEREGSKSHRREDKNPILRFHEDARPILLHGNAFSIWFLADHWNLLSARSRECAPEKNRSTETSGGVNRLVAK